VKAIETAAIPDRVTRARTARSNAKGKENEPLESERVPVSKLAQDKTARLQKPEEASVKALGADGDALFPTTPVTAGQKKVQQTCG
jgi:hypothetical protein